MKRFFLFFSVFLLIMPFNITKAETEEDSKNKDYLSMMNIDDTWESGYTGKGVNIAVIDSGFGNPGGVHKDFEIFKGMNFENGPTSEPEDFSADQNPDAYHGTHVLGIMAAKHNGIGMKGIAPDAKYFALKAGNSDIGSSDDTLRALEWVFNYNKSRGKQDRIHIINLSRDYEHSYFNTEDIIKMNNVIKNLWLEQKVFVVVASGNEGEYESYKQCGGELSKNEHVISVSSFNPFHKNNRFLTKDDDGKDAFSCPNDNVSIAATGSSYYSTVPFVTNYDYLEKSGTSMAAPIVSGTLALYKEMFPNSDEESILSMLYTNVQKLNGYKNQYGWDTEFGYGIIRMPEKINYNIVSSNTNPPKEAFITFYPEPNSDFSFVHRVPLDEFGRTNIKLDRGIIDSQTNNISWYRFYMPGKGYGWVTEDDLDFDGLKVEKNEM